MKYSDITATKAQSHKVFVLTLRVFATLWHKIVYV